MRISPAPGYLVLRPYTLKKKIGSFEMPKGNSEDAPELGEVLEVGKVITKMPYDAKHIPKKGDVVAYKKYNAYTMTIGVSKFIAVHFDNFLFTLPEADK